MHSRNGLDGVGVVVVGYGRTELSPRVVDLLHAVADSVVVVNPRGREAVVVPDSVRSVTMPSNAGYAAAVNRGEAALDESCDVLIVLTHDATATTDDVSQLVATLRADTKSAVVGPALQVGGERRVGGDYPGPGRARHRVDERADGPRVVDWVDGAIMAIRRDVFRALGGFDVGTFMYADELSFCLAAADSGWSVVVEPRVMATQRAGATQRPRAHAFLIARNHVRLARRRGGTVAALRAVAAGLGLAARALARATVGSGPGRRFQIHSALGAADGSVSGLLGGQGPPPDRVTRGSDVVLSDDAVEPTGALSVVLLYWGRRGAGARITYELAAAMIRRGDVDVRISMSRHVELRNEIVGLGTEVHEVGTPASPRDALLGGPGLVAGWFGLARLIRRSSPTVVLVPMGSPWSDVVARPLGWFIRRRSARFVRFVHDAVPHPGDRNRSPEFIERAAMAGADTYVVLSEHVEEQLVDTGVSADRVWRSALGPFSLGERRERVGEPHDPFRVLFFGRLAPYKGVHLLAEAAEMLDGGPVHVEIRVIGDGDLPIDDSPATLSVERRWVDEADVRATLVWADAVVLPYVEASQSGVTPMAQALGIPAIVTPVGGLVEQVEPGVTGVVAAQVDGSALAAAIAELAGDSDRYREMAQRCAESPTAAAAWDGIVADLVTKIRASRPARE